MDYKGIKCPVCEKPFTENDDIVVCPVCGAPYHRACYAEKGACIFTELHENGGVWAPPPPPSAPDAASEIKDKECPNCGTLNAHSALFCSICGTSLTGSPDQHRNSAYTTQNQNVDNTRTGSVYGSYPPPAGIPHGFPGVPFAFDPMGGVNPAEPLADNVTYGDASKLIQQNSGYYLSVFRYMNMYKRNKFNFSAFLFSGGWLLYRKQYKAGIITTVLMSLLYIGNMLLYYLVVNPILLSVVDAAGVSSSELTYVRLVDMLSQHLMDNPTQYLLFCTPLICYALMLGIMIFIGVRGNRMYMNHCIRTVQTIKRTSQNEGDSSMAYAQRGGVNVAVTFCLLACYFVMRWIPILFV